MDSYHVVSFERNVRERSVSCKMLVRILQKVQEKVAKIFRNDKSTLSTKRWDPIETIIEVKTAAAARSFVEACFPVATN